MKAQTVIAVVAALLVGVLLGYFVPQLTTTAPEPEAKAVKATEKRRDRNKQQANHDADLNRLRARITKLEQENNTLQQELAQLNEVLAAKEPIEQPSTNRVDHPPFGRPPSIAEMRARAEEMRKNDPEAYAQMTNSFARRWAHHLERRKQQFNILANADTAHMTKAQRKVHEDYQDLLARQEQIFEQMNPNNPDITDEQREALRNEMHENLKLLHDLQRAERDTLLTQTANALGYTGEDANVVVDEIKAVYEATSGGHHGPPPGGGPGGWGRHGGGRRGRR